MPRPHALPWWVPKLPLKVTRSVGFGDVHVCTAESNLRVCVLSERKLDSHQIKLEGAQRHFSTKREKFGVNPFTFQFFICKVGLIMVPSSLGQSEDFGLNSREVLRSPARPC